MPELLHKTLTASILRAYYDVYNGTARIYPERFYDRAMAHDLTAMGMACALQPQWQVLYKEKIVGRQILDILVAGKVIIENKAAPNLTRLHKAQLLSYLKVTGKQIGLLLNFGGPKPEFERLYFAPREPRAG
jgi:GxxExxY protein